MRRFAVALLVTFALTACYKEMRQAARSVTQTVKKVQALEQKLQQRYPGETVDVGYHRSPRNTALNVAFINSPLNDAKYMERDARANEVAAFVKGDFGDIDKIVVVFRRVTKSGAAEVKSNIDTFDFPGR